MKKIYMIALFIIFGFYLNNSIIEPLTKTDSKEMAEKRVKIICKKASKTSVKSGLRQRPEKCLVISPSITLTGFISKILNGTYKPITMVCPPIWML